MPHEELSCIVYCRFLYIKYCIIISLTVHCGKLSFSALGWMTWRGGGQGNHASRRCNATLRVVSVFDVATWWEKYQTCKQTYKRAGPYIYPPGIMPGKGRRHDNIWSLEKNCLPVIHLLFFYLQLSYFNMLFLIITCSFLEFKKSNKFLCLNSDTIKWISVKSNISSPQINLLKLRPHKTRVPSEVINLTIVFLLC